MENKIDLWNFDDDDLIGYLAIDPTQIPARTITLKTPAYTYSLFADLNEQGEIIGIEVMA